MEATRRVNVSSFIYVGGEQILQATEDWPHCFHTSDSVLMAPVAMSLDAPQSPLVWHGIPPSTKLSMTERIVSRVKSVNVGGTQICVMEIRHSLQ